MVNTFNNHIDAAKKIPIPKMLFAEFWGEKELCILFAKSGIGKSALAVQIANSISKGVPIAGFAMDAGKQTVLYCDFELNVKQLEKRYSNNYKDHYIFDDNLLRVTLSSTAILPKKKIYEEYVIKSLEEIIVKKKSTVVVLDNITYITNTLSSIAAGRLLDKLKKLKEKYALSILVLAHTTKNHNKPLTLNDIYGSSMIGNFIDSSFAIGVSAEDSSIRYIKQLKSRNTKEFYGDNNVCVCEITQQTNFLKFEFVDFGKEEDYLEKSKGKIDESELIEHVLQLHLQGMSLRDIASDLDINHMKVNRIIIKNVDL